MQHSHTIRAPARIQVQKLRPWCIVSSREEVEGNDDLTTGPVALIAIIVLSAGFLIYAWSVTVDRIRLSFGCLSDHLNSESRAPRIDYPEYLNVSEGPLDVAQQMTGVMREKNSETWVLNL